MTTQQVRDELAKMMGWMLTREGGDTWRHKDPTRPWSLHPIPDTIESALACLPEGLSWRRYGGVFYAFDDGGDEIEVPDTGNVKADLFNLALAAQKASVKK